MPAQTGAKIQTTLGGSVSGNIKHIGGGALVHNGEVLPESEVSPSRQEIAFCRPRVSFHILDALGGLTF